MINFDTFQEINLKVGKIIKAEKIEKADKLLKLQVSLGTEKRQIIAGIANAYQPKDLIGKRIVIVANLRPRKIFGLQSEGMLLAATSGKRLALISPDKNIRAGAQIS